MEFQNVQPKKKVDKTIIIVIVVVSVVIIVVIVVVIALLYKPVPKGPFSGSGSGTIGGSSGSTPSGPATRTTNLISTGFSLNTPESNGGDYIISGGFDFYNTLVPYSISNPTNIVYLVSNTNPIPLDLTHPSLFTLPRGTSVPGSNLLGCRLFDFCSAPAVSYAGVPSFGMTGLGFDPNVNSTLPVDPGIPFGRTVSVTGLAIQATTQKATIAFSQGQLFDPVNDFVFAQNHNTSGNVGVVTSTRILTSSTFEIVVFSSSATTMSVNYIVVSKRDTYNSSGVMAYSDILQLDITASNPLVSTEVDLAVPVPLVAFPIWFAMYIHPADEPVGLSTPNSCSGVFPSDDSILQLVCDVSSSSGTFGIVAINGTTDPGFVITSKFKCP